MIIALRRLTEAGLVAFRRAIVEGDATSVGKLKESDVLTELAPGNFLLDDGKAFATTYDLGHYLHTTVFYNVKEPSAIYQDAGLWAWISLVYIDSLVRKRERGSKGKGTPLAPNHYMQLDEPGAKRQAYRLIARSAWWLVRLHGKAAVIVFGSPDSPWGELAEQVVGRQLIATHRGFFSVAERLYLNSEGAVKKGAASHRSKEARLNPKAKAGLGSMRRLALTLNQFGRTYNTRAISPDAMLKLLPEIEYRRWAAR
jgi:hypothetical protein